MQLLLLRHADANTVASSDNLRPLSSKGREQAKRVARFCKTSGLIPDLILTSPLLRTEETARIVARELDCETLTSRFLTSGMTPFVAYEELRAYTRFESLMLVGHEPDFSTFAGSIIGAEHAGALHFRKATLAGLDVEALSPGGARLEFLIPVKLLG